MPSSGLALRDGDLAGRLTCVKLLRWLCLES